MQTYRDRVDAERISQMREILKELPQACGDFLRFITMTTSSLTRLAYAIDLNTFFHFLQVERVAFSHKPLYLMNDDDLAALTQSDLIAYMDYLTLYYKAESGDDPDDAALKPTVNHELSIKRKMCAIRSFYDFLFKQQRIKANIPQLVELPKIHEKPIIRLETDEMERILSVAETGEQLTERQKAYQKLTARRDYAILSLFLGTGIRVSELVGMNVMDVDLEENAFLITRKGGNQVVLYFPPEVAEALADYMDERSQVETLEGHEDALFLSLQRRRITQRAVQNLVKKYAACAAPLKTKISPHKLRSTYATNLYHATGDIYLVADMLGHTSVDTTRKHYADMTDRRRRMAAQSVVLPTRQGISAADSPEDEEKQT